VLRGQHKKREGRATDGLRPPPRFEDEVAESSGQELDMYFSRPQQLLEEFTQLEESNLFLIQNCQDSEQQLEELKQQYRDAERTWTRNTATLEVRFEVGALGLYTFAKASVSPPGKCENNAESVVKGSNKNGTIAISCHIQVGGVVLDRFSRVVLPWSCFPNLVVQLCGRRPRSCHGSVNQTNHRRVSQVRV
jgi:hypothetical protein